MSKRLLLAVLLSVYGRCQSAGIDFSGTWKLISTRTGQSTTSLTEIKQTETTVALHPVLPGQSSVKWSIFPTNGKVISEKRMGHMATRRSARWSHNKLILETSGEGSAPWRRSQTTQILSLSRNGTLLTMRFRFSRPELDYDVVLEKLQN